MPSVTSLGGACVFSACVAQEPLVGNLLVSLYLWERVKQDVMKPVTTLWGLISWQLPFHKLLVNRKQVIFIIFISLLTTTFKAERAFVFWCFISNYLLKGQSNFERFLCITYFGIFILNFKWKWVEMMKQKAKILITLPPDWLPASPTCWVFTVRMFLRPLPLTPLIPLPIGKITIGVKSKCEDNKGARRQLWAMLEGCSVTRSCRRTQERHKWNDPHIIFRKTRLKLSSK